MRGLVLALALLATAAPAVQPDEILPDPQQEERAREISKELRCLVCRNEAIDDSNADLARDLRLLVRERIVAGDSDAEVKQYLVDRYGEFVLLKPTFTMGNLLLWGGGPLLFLLGLGASVAYLRGRRPEAVEKPEPDPLSADEQARLRRLMDG